MENPKFHLFQRRPFPTCVLFVVVVIAVVVAGKMCCVFETAVDAAAGAFDGTQTFPPPGGEGRRIVFPVGLFASSSFGVACLDAGGSLIPLLWG